MKNKCLISILILGLFSIVLSGCFFNSGNHNPSDEPVDGDIPSIVIVEDDYLTKKNAGATYWYNLKLPKDYQYTLNISLSDYSGDDYYLDYEFEVENDYKDCVSYSNYILQTKSTAEVGDSAYFIVNLKHKGKSGVIDREHIFIDVLDSSAFITASLTSKSDDVQISESQTSSYDFIFTIPMAGKLYKMPLVEIRHVQGDYSVEFAVDDDESVELSAEREEFFFKINPAVTMYNKNVYIDVKNTSNETLRRFICRLSVSYDDPDVFQMFYGNSRQQMKNNETMYIEKSTTTMPLDFYFNSSRVNSASSILTIDIENTSIISKSRASTIYGYNHIFNILSVGNTNVTVTYNKGGSHERIIEFVVSVYDGKNLTGIYVPTGSNAFSIDGDNVRVNGKIYATFEVGEPEAINGYNDLIITKSDTLDSNVKNVHLEYTYKGDTAEADYKVEVNKTSGYQKTDLTQNYQTYWNEVGYTSTTYEGDVKVLAIPVWFNDSSNFINEAKSDENGLNQKEQILEDLNTSLFGSNDDVLGRSLRTYYLEESLGTMNISGKVTTWYEIDKKTTYYEDKDSEITTLAKEAVDWYFNESGTTDVKSDFDGNGDGKIDHVILLYGANYHCFRNGYSVASGWCRRLPNSQLADFSNYTWMSTMHMYDTCGLSPNAYNQYSTDDLSSIHGINARTVTHEFAHAIGIADMYDTSMKTTPTGSFNMQSSNEGGHDAYNVMAMGYAKPYVFSANDASLDDEIEIEINDMQSSGDIILLTPNWSTTNEIFDEYMLLELYTPTGLNAYDAKNTNTNADCTGIRLWHVNAVRNNSTHRHLYTNNSENENFDLVHFIRNDKNESYRSLTTLKQDYLFIEGNTFSMDEFKSQFYNQDGKLDNGLDLGWNFSVKSITKDDYGNAKATIVLTKTL